MNNRTIKILVIAGIVVILLVAGFFTSKLILQGNFLSFLNNPLTSMKSERAPEQYTDTQSGSEYLFSTGGKVSVAETAADQTSFGLKIMKHGALSMLADKGKFFDSWNKITALTSVYSGNIISSNYYKESDYYFGSITVVIPSKDFDNFIKELSDVGKVERLNVSSQDVTGEYVDLNSRLKVLESQRDLLLGWLKEAKTVDEMIKLRTEIQKTEEEIETIKGRLNYISFHTDFCDITITLGEKGVASTSKTPVIEFIIYWLKKPLIALLYSIVGLFVILAFLIPWGLVGFGIYKLVVKRKVK